MNASAEVKKAVYLTATETEPRTYGKQVMMGGVLDHLCDRLGDENVHLVLIGKPDHPRPPTRYQRHILAKPGAGAQVGALARRVAGRPHTSIQEAAVYSPRIEKEIRALLAEIDADLELWDTIRLGQYAPAMPRKLRLLVQDDLFSVRYRTMLREMSGPDSRAVNPLGDFQRLLPGPVRPIVSRKAVYRPLLRAEAHLVTERELVQPTWFDGTLMVNVEETANTRAATGLDTIHTMMPSLPEPAARNRNPVGAQFAFLGSLQYAPNADGLIWFLANCREQVLNALPDFQLLVIGRGTDVGVPEAEPWGDHVKFLGWVDDLGETLSRCAALLSVLRVASGIKIKVLEALSRGLPVVATPYGVEGTPVDESNGCLVGNTPDELAKFLVQAADPAQNAILSAAARATWEQRFARDAIRESYDELLFLNRRR
jgi:hypothetical protein